MNSPVSPVEPSSSRFACDSGCGIGGVSVATGKGLGVLVSFGGSGSTGVSGPGGSSCFGCPTNPNLSNPYLTTFLTSSGESSSLGIPGPFAIVIPVKSLSGIVSILSPLPTLTNFAVCSLTAFT